MTGDEFMAGACITRTIGSRERMVLEATHRKQSIMIRKLSKKYCYSSMLNFSDLQCLLYIKGV